MKYVSKDDKISIKKVKKSLKTFNLRFGAISFQTGDDGAPSTIPNTVQVNEMACEHFKRVRIDNREL